MFNQFCSNKITLQSNTTFRFKHAYAHRNTQPKMAYEVQSFHIMCLQTIWFISMCENKDALSAAQSLCIYFFRYCIYDLIVITKYIFGRNIDRIDLQKTT